VRLLTFPNLLVILVTAQPALAITVSYPMRIVSHFLDVQRLERETDYNQLIISLRGQVCVELYLHDFMLQCLGTGAILSMSVSAPPPPEYEQLTVKNYSAVVLVTKLFENSCG
jgi:hypothetical protein